MPSAVGFVGEKFDSQQIWKKTKSVAGITPKCNNNNQHFITAEGFYSPCCYLADHRFYYKNQFGKNKSEYDIRNTTLSAILKKSSVIDFYHTLDQHSGCQFNCPSAT